MVADYRESRKKITDDAICYKQLQLMNSSEYYPFVRRASGP